MKLDKHFMGSILSLYEELLTNGISIVYIGKFTQKITTFFSAMFEEEMEEKSENKKTRKRVFHSLVEILQNMQRHSVQITKDVEKGSGLFMLGKRDDVYYIITSNTISKNTIPGLTHAIETVNNASIEDLRGMYKKQLRDGNLSEKGGAGLGLIDIARKTQEKLEYLFIPIDNNLYYFILKTEINTKTIMAASDEKNNKDC